MPEETMVRAYQQNTTQPYQKKAGIASTVDALSTAHSKRQKPMFDAFIETKVWQPVKKCCHYINETSKALQERQGQLWAAALPLLLLLLATLFLLLEW